MRLSVLTPGGIHAWQVVVAEKPALTNVFAHMADLLRAQMQLTIEERRDEEEE